MYASGKESPLEWEQQSREGEGKKGKSSIFLQIHSDSVTDWHGHKDIIVTENDRHICICTISIYAIAILNLSWMMVRAEEPFVEGAASAWSAWWINN